MSDATLTDFARSCEKTISMIGVGWYNQEPMPFCAPEDRDRWRVYAIAKLAGLVDSGREVEEMLMVAPGIYEALLRAFRSLVTGRGLLWWQSREYAKNKAWPRYIRDSIRELAARLELDPKELADELDAGSYPWTRALIIRTAEGHLKACR